MADIAGGAAPPPLLWRGTHFGLSNRKYDDGRTLASLTLKRGLRPRKSLKLGVCVTMSWSHFGLSNPKHDDERTLTSVTLKRGLRPRKSLKLGATHFGLSNPKYVDERTLTSVTLNIH